MTIKTTQKIIKIGTSRGVTIPAKELRRLGVDTGSEVEVTVKAIETQNSDADVIEAAKAILERYKQDFENLAQR